MKILCGGPVAEDADVYEAHIESLLAQGVMDYKGIDNSPVPLVPPFGFRTVFWRREETLGEYKERRVRWDKNRMRFVGMLREEMRLKAIKDKYDYLFMVDSDLILGKGTLQKLLDSGKDFIAGLFWSTKPNWRSKWPNVWDVKGFKHYKPSEALFQKLKKGGVHEVGLTGGCSLISKYALPRISYKPRQQIAGEDMCACLSARKAGISVFVHCDVDIEHRRRR